MRPAGWPKESGIGSSRFPSRSSSRRPASWPKDSGSDTRSFPTRSLGVADELAVGVRQRHQLLPVSVELAEAGELAKGYRQRHQVVPDEVAR